MVLFSRLDLRAATIVVNSLGDIVGNDGACTLREAITAGNNNLALGGLPGECSAGAPGADTIAFNIAGGCSPAACTIVLSAALPTISEPAVIDGYTQPGSAVNTDPSASNAALKIEIDGSMVSLAGGVLNLAAGNSVVRGLVINRAGLGTSAIQISSGNNRVEGNFLGTAATGMVALPNSGHGILVEMGSANLIGGASSAARNLISGNAGNGVYIVSPPGATSGNTVQGNLIGTSIGGTVALGNLGNGVQISNAPGNVIADNVVSGNQFSGIFLLNGGTVGNVVRGNRIGVDAAGNGLIGNTFEGVRVDPTAGGNSIGGATPAEGNIVAGNGEAGIGIGGFGKSLSSTGNSVRSNSVYSNNGLGIDLLIDGVTSNDLPCDGDTGPNDLQNFPSLAFGGFNSGIPSVLVALNSTASTDLVLDFYTSPVCDPSGFGEGRTFLGSAAVTTDAACLGSTEVLLPGAAGSFVTATATNTGLGTSEFSACLGIPVGPSPTPSATATPTPSPPGATSAVPTLSSSALGVLAVALAVIAVLLLRRE